MKDLQKRLIRAFPDGGYFVEAGAHDGVGDSLTLPLEKAGWKGLCVEPSSHFHGLSQNRQCDVSSCCLSDKCGVVIFREIDGDAVELSGLPAFFQEDGWDRESRPYKDRYCHSLTLPKLLECHLAPPVIQFLCLDTEGSELAILQAHDFSLYRFLVILVEHNGNQRRKEALRAFLGPEGYVCRDAGIDLLCTYGDITGLGTET